MSLEVRIRLILDAKNDGHAKNKLKKIKELFDFSVESMEPYEKGGFTVFLRTNVDGNSWPEYVYNLILTVKKVGAVSINLFRHQVDLFVQRNNSLGIVLFEARATYETFPSLFNVNDVVIIETEDPACAEINGQRGTIIDKIQGDDDQWVYGILPENSEVRWSLNERELVAASKVINK